jgi:RHS repeat-associated protein
MKTKLTFALVAALTSTAFAGFQAPLPEFKNEKQLVEWRAEKASEATSQGYAAEETVFYTGKPYLASSGGYAFKYRSYDPELARWTSEDPSGFPDGANSNSYINNKITTELDFEGLKATGVFASQVHTISLTVLVYADANSDPSNSITESKLNDWTTSVNSAWAYSGTDKSNQQNLSLQTNISFKLAARNWIYNEGDALLNYDNVITFGGDRANVRGYQVGFFPIDISIAILIHEIGHFMNVSDAYNDIISNGIITGHEAKTTEWKGTVMACEASQATKRDANAVIYANSNKKHLFE